MMERLGKLGVLLGFLLHELALMLLLVLIGADPRLQDDFDLEERILIPFLRRQGVLVAVVPVRNILIERLVTGPAPGLGGQQHRTGGFIVWGRGDPHRLRLLHEPVARLDLVDEVVIHDRETFAEMQNYVLLPGGGYGNADQQHGHDDTVAAFYIALASNFYTGVIAPYGSGSEGGRDEPPVWETWENLRESEDLDLLTTGG